MHPLTKPTDNLLDATLYFVQSTEEPQTGMKSKMEALGFNFE